MTISYPDRKFTSSALAALLLFAMSLAMAQSPKAPPPGQPAGSAVASPLAPLPPQVQAVSTHAPFAAGECGICHQGADPKRPGPLRKTGAALCLDCHDEFTAVLQRRHPHAPAKDGCTSCHNPHNAKAAKLALAEPRELCGSCHADIKAIANTAKVRHGAMDGGKQCVACHDPHASAVAKLLVEQPFDLCVGCHKVDTLADAQGRKLQNIKALLEANKHWHGPLEARDCSACHEPHGGGNFRLLTEVYPPEFYAPYDARNYALCFACHKEEAFSTPETTVLTKFRDGSKNMHYLHLRQGARGRTCRACHEVHASSQANHIRDGVPYGNSGWVLKLNYKQTAAGGSCEKTCHQERSYNNGAAAK
jgi:predicted CXXCH cytochrome family protein